MQDGLEVLWIGKEVLQRIAAMRKDQSSGALRIRRCIRTGGLLPTETPRAGLHVAPELVLVTT